METILPALDIAEPQSCTGWKYLSALAMLLFSSPGLCPTRHQTDLSFNLLQLLSQELQHTAGGICLPATSGVGQNNGIMLGCPVKQGWGGCRCSGTMSNTSLQPS